ncbi:TMV resistance protein N [Glycine soja]
MRDGQSSIITQLALTPETASVLKESIAMAREKKHLHTTPLHVVAKLLDSPSGFLHQACMKSQPTSYPLQYQGLELCLNVAMNRLPMSISSMEPLISNSLKAAFKRIRAQQHGRQPPSTDKVELEQLILSILDDPSVSKVMKAAGYSSPDISATFQRGRKYEVFISFRGEDTRSSFTSHLYAALQNAGIIVFKDDESLPRGHHISDSLLLAIEQSQISVVVFSRNYADSRWCLKELERIMECHRTIGHVVVPVFYDVDPSEVRHQTSHFGNAFQNLLNRMSIDLNSSGEMEMMLNNETNLHGKSWREALREAASISGVVVLDSRNESEAIKNIVENVTRLLDKTELFIADNPVGVESRVQDMIQLLDQKLSNDVVLLGIWGMGGIGKTTIAKAIFNKIGRNFEGRSFLAQIREAWEQDAGQVHLQEQLLFDIDKESKTKIPNIELGKNILKERLRHKKVLLILDDVNKLHQLNALCGNREWFGSGSRIIITTRDMHILRGRRVDKVYTMKEMNEDESIELFSWHAFKQPSPREDFTELSRNVIAYSGGLPLALEVLGSYLFDMEVTEWKCVLEKLKKIPNDEVQEKLKISFDGLNDDTEREIFLDIACFFIGMDRNDVIHILNGSELYAENGIRVLVERSLVTVDKKNKLGMHDLLRDMGREIIRVKSPKEPEERSRLWFHEDVLDVLLKESGTKAVEGLTLMLPRSNTKCLSTTSFKKMKKLRLLQFAGVELAGDFKNLSRDLRWLYWDGFPFKCIPADLYQGSLVSIELENSNISHMWKEALLMEKLKILNLSHSHYLTQTPDFSNLPYLEKLILIDCPRLFEVSHTIGHLRDIVLINLEDCVSLRNLPRSIYNLKSLKTLILSGCLMIDKLEEDLEQMKSLTTLIADRTAITRVPFSVVRSKSIGYISLCGYEGFSRDVFPSIIWSWMSPTNNPLCLVESYAGMSSLVSFNVPNSSSSHDLLTISKELPKLRSLWVECNSKLQLSQDTRIILDALHADTNFEEKESSTTTTSQGPNTKTSALIECSNQEHISGSKSSLKSLLIQMGTNCQGSNILKENILQNMTTSGCDSGLYPGDNYPDWLTFNCDGSSVIFDVPQVNGYNLKTMMFIIHSFTPDNITSDGLKNVLVINHTKFTIQLYKRGTLVSFEDEEWQRAVSNIEPGNKVEAAVVFENGFTVKKTTVYLIYDEPNPNDKKLEYCHASDKNVVVSGRDENVSVVGWISPQVESTNDFKQKQKRRKFE